MVTPGQDIILYIKGHFETTEVRINTNDTIGIVKTMVRLEWSIPVSQQTYFFRGLCASDDQILRDIGVEDGSIITMNIQSKFLERVHPFHIRDPLTGFLPRKPIRCSDNFSYDQVSLEQWRSSLQRQSIRSPMYGNFMKVGELNESLQDDVATYLQDIDAGKAEEDYLSLDCLGRIHNILGHFREIIGPIPRCKRPRIVCIGNESIGKSAEMERLTFMCIFPRGEERCTRIAVEIRCHRGPTTNPVLRVISGRGMGTESDEEEDARENGRDCLWRVVVPLQKGAEEMQTQMTNVMDRVTAEYAGTDVPPEVCVDRYIVLDLTGPTLADVTFVDFPGLAANDKDLMVAMLNHDFEKFGEHSIYLHMTKASEFTEDGPYAVLQGFAGGQLLDQTVAIVTQMDLANKIPNQPERAEQLIQLALGEKAADRDQLFPCGTFLVMNKDDKNDPPSGFESVYLRAAREKKFLAERGLDDDFHLRNVAGNNALIEQIHRMYFSQLKHTLLPQAIGKLQERLTDLNRRENGLGRPAVVYSPSSAELLPLLNRITTGIISTLQSKLSIILLKFDCEQVQPLELDLRNFLAPTRRIPKLEVDKNIRGAYHDILACFTDRKATHMAFWLEELQTVLQADRSELMLGRFTALIDALKVSIKAKLDAFYAMLHERFEEIFDIKDVTDKFSCVIRADRCEDFDVPMVQLSFRIDSGTLAHIMCDSMRIFSEAISNTDYISEVMRPCSLVEECRLERFDIWNERRLLHESMSEMLDMAHNFESIGCVMCSGRLVSLCHANTASVLEICDGACVIHTFPQYVSDILSSCNVKGSSVLEGRSGARFQVVDAGNGDVAFYCPSTSQYLCVKRGILGVNDAHPDEITSRLHPGVLFRAEFHPPPESMAAHASSALSLYNAHSNTFVTVSAPTTGSCVAVVALVAPDARGLPPDNYAAVFLVGGNPEE